MDVNGYFGFQHYLQLFPKYNMHQIRGSYLGGGVGRVDIKIATKKHTTTRGEEKCGNNVEG